MPDTVSARDRLAQAALASLPHILMQQDRNPVSATYGCFDRAYWHYRILDFPCGMSQEFVLPLALAWALPMPGNRWHGEAAVRDWVEAGIRYAARAAHADGSCDDYYPHERAAGAAAFSLFACLEAAKIVGLEGDAEVEAFFAKRAGWLAHHQESGRLSNHEALIIACLARMSQRDAARWNDALAQRVARIASWQSDEGWFDEYGGADPGYLTLTIGMLADADAIRPDLTLQPMIGRAVRFLATMVHPDGTLGGEYTSRATVNFFPHGLEMVGARDPQALAIAERGYRRFEADVGPSHADDRIVGHHAWSRMLAWRAWQAERPAPLPLAEGLIDHEGAQIRVQAKGVLRLFVGWGRGAAFRLFDGERLLRADTGPTLALADGKVAVSHLPGMRVVERTVDAIEIEGPMAYAKTARLTPPKSIVLRLMMLSVGRWFPDLVRRMLQAILVTGRKDAPFHASRRIAWEDGALVVTDRITPRTDWAEVRRAGIGGFQVSITTIMARVWEPAQLQPFDDVTAQVRALSGAAPLTIVRRYEPVA